jgi:hypothetical protein
MTAQPSSQNDWRTPCTSISVLVSGTGPMVEILVPLLRGCGHPIVVSPTPPLPTESTTPTVVLLLCQDVSDCCALADELHQNWPQAPVVIATAHLSVALEDQIGVRAFARLRTTSTTGEEFHMLVHDALEPAPDTTPHALKPRTTDHPPSPRAADRPFRGS